MIMRILSVTWFVFVIINERVWKLGANSYGNFPIWKQPLLIMSLAVPFWSLLVDDNQQIGIIYFILNKLLSCPSPSPCPNRPPRHATFWPKVSFHYMNITYILLFYVYIFDVECTAQYTGTSPWHSTNCTELGTESSQCTQPLLLSTMSGPLIGQLAPYSPLIGRHLGLTLEWAPTTAHSTTTSSQHSIYTWLSSDPNISRDMESELCRQEWEHCDQWPGNVTLCGGAG